MKQKFINLYLRIAEEFANMSMARRLKVGCVIVKNNKIISCGYNGTVSGMDNTCEEEWDEYVVGPSGEPEPFGLLKTLPTVIHAEMNALLGVAQSNESTKDSTMFCTHFPCMNCAKHIVQSGIKEIHFKEVYREQEAETTAKFLADCGVTVTRFEGTNVHEQTRTDRAEEEEIVLEQVEPIEVPLSPSRVRRASPLGVG